MGARQAVPHHLITLESKRQLKSGLQLVQTSSSAPKSPGSLCGSSLKEASWVSAKRHQNKSFARTTRRSLRNASLPAIVSLHAMERTGKPMPPRRFLQGGVLPVSGGDTESPALALHSP